MLALSLLPLPLLALLLDLPLPISASSSPELGINTTHPVSCSRPSQSGDKLSINYRGRLQSTGAEFDNSYDRGSPFKFTLGAGEVIAGWDQGLLDMCPGEERELTIPPELGYGNRGMRTIPAGSTLVFETALVEIVGVVQEEVEQGTKTEEDEGAAFGIATAPASPPATATPVIGLEDIKGNPDNHQQPQDGNGECQLLGPFALIVQGALGGMALLALVYKRFRESPKRPWKIWFFDASKQVLGSMLLHVINLFMSLLGAGDLGSKSATAAATTDAAGGQPNPCSFYILNLGIDTTIGVPVLYILLKLFHSLYSYTPLASPPESIKSGHYGQPPKLSWYLKQLLIYFTGLIFMKLFVWFLFAALPWLPWVGDWALRWTEGDEGLQIAFTMFLFPLAMNIVQYYVIDGFIMEKKGSEEGEGGKYQRVEGDEEDGEAEGSRTEVGEEDEEATSRKRDVEVEEEDLVEADTTPIPHSNGEGSGGRNSPKKDD
ncbi:hypothetical protein B0A48_03240 [Cryoendolithus antarcticus]|uniref:peptidylprolyl isomerase n=1 Tax=Cryoendolithus antarcticus TaxID=1507870 RepID=A0A1V8TJF2_9PEZI|nr:hypothetical protein B0A48_03240 [Cryoendolithus antarcticus]